MPDRRFALLDCRPGKSKRVWCIGFRQFRRKPDHKVVLVPHWKQQKQGIQQ
jgi:hypothetical protein